MNPFIKELAEQASHQSPDGYPVTIPYSDAFVVKFAELIIKECVNGIGNWRDASDDQMDKESHWQGYRSGCDDSIVEIQTRFAPDNSSWCNIIEGSCGKNWD
jgi:hypothetical protein